MVSPDFLFAITALSTFFCLGVNAYTWRIGYALWPLVGDENFGRYHAGYLQQLNSIITIPHILMFLSSATLVFLRPAWFGLLAALAACALAWAVVGISAFLAGPVHERFSKQRRIDLPGFNRLMWISAARTMMLFIATGLLLAGMLRGLQT